MVVAAIPTLWRLRQENCKFKASLSCMARPCLNKQKQPTKKTLKNSDSGPGVWLSGRVLAF
jgi:hypothetical protein